MACWDLESNEDRESEGRAQERTSHRGESLEREGEVLGQQ